MTVKKQTARSNGNQNEQDCNDYSDSYDVQVVEWYGEKVYQLKHWNNPDRKGCYTEITLGHKESTLKLIIMILETMKAAS